MGTEWTNPSDPRREQIRQMGLSAAINLTGRRFGQLTVVERAPNAGRRAMWRCLCDCGTVAVKKGKYLLNGDTNSCGCAQRQRRESGNPKYGDTAKGRREYTIWRSMKSRCYTPTSSNFKFYGARGVTVCDRWRDDYAEFLADMGPCPADYTLDRIDPRGNYEPSNCRWASWDVQHGNLRRHHATPHVSLPSLL